MGGYARRPGRAAELEPIDERRAEDWGMPPAPAAWSQQGDDENVPRPTGHAPQRGGLPLNDATFNVFPPWLYPPRSATRYNVTTSNVLAVVGVTTPIPFAPLVTWKQGVEATLNYYEITVLNPVATIDLYFTILFNQTPIPGLDRLRVPSIVAAGVITGDTPYVVLAQQGELTMTVTNNGATNLRVNGHLAGWTWSSSDITERADRSTYIQPAGGRNK